MSAFTEGRRWNMSFKLVAEEGRESTVRLRGQPRKLIIRGLNLFGSNSPPLAAGFFIRFLNTASSANTHFGPKGAR